jgi:streptogramin lyase
MAALAECRKRLVRRGYVARRASLLALLLGVLVVFGAGVAGAAPLGAITEFANPGSNDAQVRAGSDGNLWFTDRTGKIGQITTGGAITEFSSGLNAGSMPFSIAAGPDGNLWFTDAGTTSAIGMINPNTDAISEFSTGLNPGSKPMGIALSPDGNLWFTDQSSGTPAIGMINPTTHVITEYSSGMNAGSAPQQGIVAGPDGNIWFTDKGTKRAIGMLNLATHAITEFSSGLNAGSAPGAAIAVGTDANLWFVDPGTTGAIGMINPNTEAITEFNIHTGSVPGRIAAGPDGNLWFTDKGTTPAIGTIDPATHVISEFSSGLNAGSLPGGIGPGADGNMWFTDQGTTRAIGRIGVGAPAASLTSPTVTGSDGVGVPQACGGDIWSSWAGQQPSHSAFDFDGYQWLLDGRPIAGATGQSYTPTVANAGRLLSCKARVTYTLLSVTVSATSAAVLVKGAAVQLTDLAGAVAGVGSGKSLAGKVAEIQGYLAANDTADACATLGALINEVNAQTGKKISTAQATSFITQAQDIEVALGC